MEDTLRGLQSISTWLSSTVLILVLMEDTLRVLEREIDRWDRVSLNPCFNGRYSQS